MKTGFMNKSRTDAVAGFLSSDKGLALGFLEKKPVTG